MTTTRQSERQRELRRRAAVAVLGSLLIHVCLVSIMGPWWVTGADPVDVQPLERDDNFVVDAQYDVEETPVEPPVEREPEPAKLAELEDPDPEPAPEEPPADEQPVEIVPIDRKVVEQVTNEEVPTDAKYLSDQANRVEEETRAREVMLEDATPSNEDEPEPPEMTSDEALPANDQEIAALAPEEQRPRPSFEPREASPVPELREKEDEELPGRDPVVVKKREKAPPRQLLIPDAAAYEEVFAQRDDSVREHAETHRKQDRKRLMPGYGELTRNVKRSLENNIYEVRPGNHTGVNAHAAVWASYVGAIHRKIHLRWANGYLMDLDLREPVGSPLNNAELNAKLEFVIRAEDGEVESVNIVRSSGQLRFDAQAVTIAYQIGPHPNPPRQIVSPNGKVYIHWNFWRDQRQCGTFGASVFLVETDEG